LTRILKLAGVILRRTFAAVNVAAITVAAVPATWKRKRDKILGRIEKEVK